MDGADLRPADTSQRTFTGWDYLALWIGLVVCVPTYYLAGNLVEMGMSWWQAILTVAGGNVIVLLPLLLTSIPGTKYGIPFPVLLRSSFGIRGAHIGAIIRGLVACGWFGIHTWICADAISSLIIKIAPAFQDFGPLPVVGITSLQLGSYVFFWLMQVMLFARGVDSIRVVEKLAAPVLILLSTALLVWSITNAGGVGPLLSKPSEFGAGMAKEGKFWPTFWPALTANVGTWSTLALNIPDFTRYAKRQRGQLLGQSVGLIAITALFSLLGIIITSTTGIIFGETITSPIDVLAGINGTWPSLLGLIGIIIATISTNLAANIVGPANALVNLAPRWMTFVRGAMVTSFIGAIVMPWKLFSSTHAYMYTWLIGISAFLGPISGILLVDYYLIEIGTLDVEALYSMSPIGRYWFVGGYNVAAIVALLLGILPSLPGFLSCVGVINSVPAVLKTMYNLAWFVGFAVGVIVYAMLMKIFPKKTGTSGYMPVPSY